MAAKSTINVVITAYNEEINIADCIESAKKLTPNVIVIDTNSTDETKTIAQQSGAKIISYPYSRFVEPVRGFAIEKSTADWVFILDADERISDELALEIQGVIADTQKTYFTLPRKNIFARKKWLKHGGWYPDKVLRLIKKEAFVKWPSQIHSVPQINGEKGQLKSGLIHYFHPTLDNMVAKTAVFEDIESDLLLKAGRKANALTFFRKYFGELNRRLLIGSGFLDGPLGIIESIYQGYSKTITYLMLYEKNKKSSTL